MWKNKAPPVLIVLLWHHFCYYKRHKGLLAVSILLPFILMGFMSIIIWQLNIPSGMQKQFYISPTRQQSVSLLSSGILQYVQGGYSCYQDATVDGDCDGHTYQCSDEQMANPDYYTDRSLLDYTFTSTATCNATSLVNLTCHSLLSKSFYKYDPSLSLLQGYIVYYPNENGSIAEKVMRKVREKLEVYHEFLINATQPDQYPTDDYQTFWPSLAIYYNLTECWVDISQRVLGFANQNDLLAFTQSNLTNENSTNEDSIPLLWGAINFDGTNDAYDSKRFSYSMMHETGSSTNSHKDVWLQDLIEEAAIKVFTNATDLPTSVLLKELPTKCWIKPSPFTFTLLLNYLPTAITIGFMLMPITFLTLVITEKYLRLGEYMYIMGVNDFVLKISWIIFFLLFLIPISILCALLLYFTPGNVFANSDVSILIVLFVLYQIAQLSWGYFLSSVMVNPQKVRFIIAFVGIFLSVFTFNTYNLSGGKLTGAFLIIIRILSLNVSTPFNLALSYYINWESVWVGAQWKLFMDSPNKGDGYHGFGECILWIIGDSILYIILAWYFKHVLPSMYGIRYPWYFFLMPSYWCGSSAQDAEMVERTIPESHSKADFEPVREGKTPGIVLKSLTKRYVADRAAISDLSITFNKNEVTAFLGENGAGKTTTMNILVGLINATSGTAMINGMNVAKNMSEIRKLLGFVPQYDILYPDLSVEDHIQFYGWLKGLSTNEIWEKMNQMLKQFGLEDSRKTTATSLSGGQKRKLSIIIAYIGNPEVIILDEPTSGVDPFSRRSIWNIVSSHRQKSTTILSTHYMEEADVLGDRIVIISAGELKCAGSSIYLKNRYGQGYRVTVATSNECPDPLAVERYLHKYIAEAKLIQESGNDRTYAVPIATAQGPEMVEFLEHFEETKDKLGVTSFGISEPTLEDVFFNITERKVKSDVIKHYGATLSQPDRNNVPQLEHNEGFQLALIQFFALFLKRVRIATRSKMVVVMQLLMPLTFTAVMLLVSGGWGSTASQTTVDLYSDYHKNIFFFQNNNDSVGNSFLQAAAMYGLNPQKSYHSDATPPTFPTTSFNLSGNCPCNSYCAPGLAQRYDSTVLPSNDIVYPLDSNANITDWVLHANQSYHWVIGGYQFFQMSNQVYDLNNQVNEVYNISHEKILDDSTMMNYTVIWTPSQFATAALNAFNNLMLRSMGTDFSEFSIILNTETANLIPGSQNTDTQIISAVSSATTCYFLVMAYIFATFGLADYLLIEKLSGLRQLQFIAGSSPIIYWSSNIFWDFIQFAVAVAPTFLLLGLVQNVFSDDLVNLVLLVIPFGLGSISFVYFMTFFLNSAGSLGRIVNLGALLCQGIGSIIAVLNVVSDENGYICKQTGISAGACSGEMQWIVPVSAILDLIPYYNIAESLSYLSLVRTLAKYNLGNTNDVDATGAFSNMLAFDRLGRRIMELWIMAVVLFLAVILMEYRGYAKICAGDKKNVQYRPLKNVDSDVAEEEEKVNSNSALNDPLVVRKIVKVYPNKTKPAVNGVSFSIPRGQCFGLLGINGAGKTSLFRILAGFQLATSGSAEIEGFDVKQDWRKVGKNMAYCPQDDTLFHTLTVEHHLELFGKLRGIKSEPLKSEIRRLIKEVGLENQLNKMVWGLSGGNKRKLQFAISLMDYRPLIFLDEPTTGMDPTARRQTWNCISDAISRGCSVVLTSHSMEECEELCHRLVIMVLGNFSCIGSVQYLKSKFGNRYTFKLKLTPYGDAKAVVGVKEYFSECLPNAEVTEENSSLIVYEIPADGLKVSYLFKTLENSVRMFSRVIEDFAMSQISLERVFINMAERQQMLIGE